MVFIVTGNMYSRAGYLSPFKSFVLRRHWRVSTQCLNFDGCDGHLTCARGEVSKLRKNTVRDDGFNTSIVYLFFVCPLLPELLGGVRCRVKGLLASRKF